MSLHPYTLRNQLCPFKWTDFDHLFTPENLWSTIGRRSIDSGITTPYCEITKDDENNYVVDAHLPGFRKEDVNLQLKDGVLSLEVKKNESNLNLSYSKSWPVNPELTEDDISASMNEGLLSIKINKKVPPEPKSISIDIK